MMNSININKIPNEEYIDDSTILDILNNKEYIPNEKEIIYLIKIHNTWDTEYREKFYNIFDRNIIINSYIVSKLHNHLDIDDIKELYTKKSLLSVCTINYAVTCRDFKLVKYLHSLGCEWNETTCAAAARMTVPYSGGTDPTHEEAFKILRWLRAQDPPCPWDEETISNAVMYENYKMVEWLRAQEPPCPWSEKIINKAVENKIYEIVFLLRKLNPPCPWDESTCESAIYEFGTLWINPEPDVSFWYTNTIDNTIQYEQINKDLRMLAWLRSNGCPWDESTISQAAFGYVSSYYPIQLEWLRAQDPPCPWSAKMLVEIIEDDIGDDAIKWFLTQDPPCPCDASVFNTAVIRQNQSIIKILHKYGCPWNEKTVAHAKSLPILELLQSFGCVHNSSTLAYAVYIKNIIAVKWLLTQDPPCIGPAYICRLPACNGNLEMLQLLHSFGYTCNANTINSAVYHGHLHIIKWLRSLDPPCPWDNKTCPLAATRSHTKILEWLCTQDPPCPWDRNIHVTVKIISKRKINEI